MIDKNNNQEIQQKKDKGNPFPAQEQAQQPGKEHLMTPKPDTKNIEYKASGKLENKVAIITGGDSGIGESVAITYAKEGADIVIIYYNEHKDANNVKEKIEKQGRQCMLIPGDIANPDFCKEAIEKVIKTFRKIDILVNNAAIQFHQESILDISDKQLQKTFATNIFSMFYLIKASLKHMKKGSTIINTTSITAYRGSHHLIDYASTKSAIVGLTRSLAKSLAQEGIRVNAVAPGPIWTPLIPSSFPKDHVKWFGSNVPMKRAGQPDEVAPSYVFLASNADSSYMTGQVLHPNGGEIIGG